MNGIKELEENVRSFISKSEARLKERKEEDLKEQQEEKIFWDKEKKLIDKKIKLLKEITKWKNELLEKVPLKRVFKHYLVDLKLFEGGWGHKNCSDYGCWSNVGLNEKGELIYAAGYKFMGMQEIIKLDKIEEAAKKLSYRYIEELHKNIMDGSVYSKVSKELGEMLSLFSSNQNALKH